MKRWILYFLTIAAPFISEAQPDSVQIFYEEHNSILTVSVQDYKNEFQTQLGDKSKSYFGHFDSLLAETKGASLFLRNGFWSAAAAYNKLDYPLLEQTALVLFGNGKAKLSQRGKSYKFEDVDTKEKDFFVCNKKNGTVAGVKVWVISKKDKSVLIAVPKNVSKEFLETEWCK